MPEIRIAALDLDGTLLSRENTVTPATRQAIADAVGRRVIVLPCTGRPLASLPPLVAQLPGIRYAITANGAAVWDMGTDPLGAVYSRYSDAARRPTHEPVLLERHCLPPETAREVFALYREYHGPLSIFSDGRSYLDGTGMALFQNRHIQRHSTEARQPDDGRTHVVRDLDEWMSRHAHEVEKFCMFFHSVKEAQRYLPRFTAIEGVEVVQGSPDNIEVTAAGVNKGESLLALADHLGIPREATLAVGDSENDRAMLEKAGIAAVMVNGMPQIKALGDLVSEADCDHDGVAELFRKLGI